MTHRTGERLKLLATRSAGITEGAEDLTFETSEGPLGARYHSAAAPTPALLWVFGAGGGLGGPAGGMYERLARRLVPSAASLQLDYRRPGDLPSCVSDVLLGIEYLGSRGNARVVLVGHSFGGAVVINAAIATQKAIGVAALSSQTAGVGDVTRISPRPILFAHGEDDEVLPVRCSLALFRQARHPKTLKLYPGCRHGLDDCR
ncbi:MAG: dienelactone hydrolase family protein [Acidobacteriaceae bacterium]|nr:dienelactone hydrolase family protein [Acidobacteriaceae bacterium]